MRVVEPGFEVMFREDRLSALKKIEAIGRVCYKSEDKITDESCVKFVQMLMQRRHYAMLEHVNVTVKWIVTRGVSHAIVRHRVGAFAQESTIYCDYSKGKFGKEIAVIDTFDGADPDSVVQHHWHLAVSEAEYAYLRLREQGVSPGLARDVLPTCLKTELVTTFNLREWRHVFEMRADPVDQALTYRVTSMILKDFQEWLPEVFGDIVPWSQQGKKNV